MAPKDFLIFFLYIAGMLGIGLYFAVKAKSADDMINAGGQSPWWVAGLSGFMTMFSAGTFVVWGGLAYSYGLVAVMVNLAYGVAALSAGWLVAGKWRELGIRTPAEYVEARFGIAAVRIYMWFMMIFRLIGAGIALYALAVLVAALVVLPEGNFFQNPDTGRLSVFWATLIFGLVIVLYTMAGGLWAVLMTDVVQFIVLNLAVIFLVPLMLIDVGGFDSFVLQAPEGFFSLTGGGYGWFFIAGWALIHVFMIGGEWAFTQRFISVPTPRDARKSAYLFGGLYLVSPFLWLAPPLIFRTITPGVAPEEAYILAAQSVLPTGVIGLMLAAMFSATASLVSSQLNVFAGVISGPWIKRLETAGAPQASLIWTVRIATVVLGIGLVTLAVAVPYLGGAERLIVSSTSLLVGPLLAPSVWGLLNRKIDFKAVIWTLIVAVTMGCVVKLGLSKDGVLAAYPVFASMASWVQTNAAAADLAVGIFSPLAVLTIATLSAKGDADGSRKIDALIAKNIQSQERVARSGEAGMIVGLTVGTSGIAMAGLAATAQEDALTLLLLSLILLLIATASIVMARRSGKL